MIAVILAAGLGIRLRPLTDVTPKGLFEIGGITLLAHSLRTLAEHGIEKTVIVIGHLGELIRREIGENCNGMEISYAENYRYATTGSMYSLSMTRGLIDDDSIILDGDILYEPRAIKRIIESRSDNCTIITNVSGSGDEVYVCTDCNDRINWLGKCVPDGKTIQGEFIGITKLSKPFLAKLFGKADDDYKKGLSGYFFEDVLFKTNVQYDDCPLQALRLPDLIWIEIDRASDYSRALNIVYPRLKRA